MKNKIFMFAFLLVFSIAVLQLDYTNAIESSKLDTSKLYANPFTEYPYQLNPSCVNCQIVHRDVQEWKVPEFKYIQEEKVDLCKVGHCVKQHVKRVPYHFYDQEIRYFEVQEKPLYLQISKW